MNREIQRRPIEFRPELLSPPEPYSGMIMIAARGAFPQTLHGIVRRAFRAVGIAQKVGKTDERSLIVRARPGADLAGQVDSHPRPAPDFASNRFAFSQANRF